VQWFRDGLVFKVHRLVFHSTLGLRAIKKKKKDPAHLPGEGRLLVGGISGLCGPLPSEKRRPYLSIHLSDFHLGMKKAHLALTVSKCSTSLDSGPWCVPNLRFFMTLKPRVE